ncbi:MAG: AsmA-like C-terminal region-containing protein [Rhodospirillaceae bacterium]
MAHGAVRFLLRVLEATLLVVLLGAAILAWRLSQGPIALNSVAPYVASLLSDLNPSLQFRIERAEFRWQGFKGSPEITARDVRVLNAAGGVVAGLPTMVVRLESSALLKGEIAPKHIGLTNPIIRFVHRADGTFGLGLEGPAPAAAAPSASEESSNALAVTLLKALNGDATGGFAFLQTVSIDHTTLVLVDEVSGQRWLVPDATLDFTRDSSAMLVQATLPVTEDGKSWKLTAKGMIPAGSRMLNLDIDIDGLRPARLAVLAPQLAPLAMVDLRLSGTMFTSMALTDQGARITGVKFDVEGQAGHLRLPEPISKDYPIKKAILRGSAGDALDEIKIDRFSMEIDRGKEANPVLTMTADAKQLNSSPVVHIEAGLGELSIEGLKEYWPPTVKPNTLRWISNNLTDGGLTGTKLRMKLTGPSMADIDATEMLLTSALHDMTVGYMDGMPKVRGANGSMALTLRDFKIDVNTGHVPDDFSGKGLRITNANLRMLGLGSGTETADFDIKIAGDFGDAMRLIDNEPLHYSTKMGVDAKQATGAADIDLSIKFPLVSDLDLDNVRVGVKAQTENVGLADVAFGLPLENGRMSLVLDGTGMDVLGTGSLGGIKTKIDWRENFSGGEFRSRYVLDPVVSNEQRPLVGLTTMPFVKPYLDGDVAAHVIYTVFHDQTRHMEADVDLTAPAMSLPELGWKKPAGVPAQGKVVARFTNDRLDEVPSFIVTSGDDLSVEGSATFGEGKTMTALTIKPSTAGESKLSLDVKRNGEGYDIVAEGSAFNATDFLKEMNRDDRLTAEEKAAGPMPMTVRANFYRAWLAKDDDFRNTTLFYERTKAGVQAIDFKGSVNGVAPVSLILKSENGARTFKAESADGGAVVRALGLFKDIVGGKLEVNGTVAPDGTLTGMAGISNFQLVQAPVLARLLSVAALSGILDELRGGGISFSTLRLPFSYANSQLSIQDGEMFGSSLGLTAKGTYSFTNSTMDMEGTLIPAYAINSALNSIPLLGDLLTGGDKGSGIFAATYTYRGPIASAEPSVNPLAALAPGFLRHIFDIFRSNPREQAAKAPSAPVADTPAK